VYIDKAEVIAILRLRDMHARADWVDRSLPDLIDISKNAALMETLHIDPTTLVQHDSEVNQPSP
jgi:hypothetical protein